MKLKVEHTTFFEYSSPIYQTATEVRLHPAENDSAPQRCLDFGLRINPTASIHEYTDFYGNRVYHFSILPAHTSLEIVATSLVETGLENSPPVVDHELYLYDFLFESNYVRLSPAILEFTERFKGIEEPYMLAEEICRETNKVFVYEPGVTDVHSTSTEVLALGRGVCQDFAHVMIAFCRAMNLPARYISGYLYGGPATEDQDRASHAWCEVYCGHDKGWIAFDPTHKTLLVNDHYIKIGAGRDYADIPPVRGTYRGTGTEQLRVTVRISAV